MPHITPEGAPATVRSRCPAGGAGRASARLHPKVIARAVVGATLELPIPQADISQVADRAFTESRDDPGIGPATVGEPLVGPHLDAGMGARELTEERRSLYRRNDLQGGTPKQPNDQVQRPAERVRWIALFK